MPAGTVMIVIEKPAVALFALAKNKVQLMVAQHGLGRTGRHQACYAPQDGRSIVAPVDKIADEHEVPAVRMASAAVVAKSPEKRLERADLAVDVPNDVEGAATKGLNKLRHTATLHGSEVLAN